MVEKRETPYIWITWLSKILSGENQCRFAFWQKAHFKSDEDIPGDFKLTEWVIKHNAMLNRRKKELEAEGYQVFIEDQNSFKVPFPNAIVSGKADIIAVKDPGVALVIDTKAGKPKTSHQVQVFLYAVLLPMGIKQYRELKFNGEVCYQNNKVLIANEEMTGSDLSRIMWDIVEELSSDIQPSITPSQYECKYCDLSCEECLEKI